jgi:uncharacterized protein YceH (UPF0502 family)
VDLIAAETRVLGCLLEKQRTTPDAYPLSLNALRLACNQSTNREPVVEYDEATIRDALHRLERRRFVRLASGAGSRAAKYRHLLDEALPIDEAERAILCVLMLRGPQTPGELKQRAERMYAFAGLGDVHDALARLIARELAIRLQRRPGQKEERYAQLLEDQTQDGSAASASANGGDSTARPEASPAPGAAESARADEGGLEELRERVERLEGEVAELRSAMRNPSPSPSPGPAHEPPRFDPRL